ncbi:MAG: hypothetical protein IJ232_08920 [Lachnospiraceae bacterium]|nr:hypothetical protein [Lachnospiraceae bacterium]
MKKISKKLLTLVMAFVLVFAMYVPASATETITVQVKIRTTALKNGQVLVSDTVVLPAGSTAMDALKAVSGGTTVSSSTVDGTTYYTQGILKWYTTDWGDYLSAVQVSGHSSTNKYFGDDGAASSWSGSSTSAYRYLNALHSTETSLGYYQDDTFNNIVHEDGYLSETDYNDYSGWMTVINGNTNNNGVSTVLSNGATVDLNFSMMMGLDLGQDSWVENSSGTWVQQSKWHNAYSFTNDTW